MVQPDLSALYASTVCPASNVCSLYMQVGMFSFPSPVRLWP